MTNGKWFALVAAFALALGLSACGGEDKNACPSGQTCLAESGACQAHCDAGTPTACTSDEDCADNEVCDTDCGGCVVACTPDGGTGGTGGTACTDQAECYPTNYCDVGGTDMCEDPGALAGCAAAHNDETVPANGVLLWGMSQSEFPGEGNCTASGPGGCTNWCAFTIFVYDPNNSLPTTHDALYKRVAYSTATGNFGPSGDVDVVDANSFVVYGCFSGSTLNGAVAIVNDNTAASPTLQSNAVCLSGTSQL